MKFLPFFLFIICAFPFRVFALDGEQLYLDMSLSGKVNETAFKQAIKGYNKLSPKKKDILVLIDYSKPSTQERFYVIDLENKKILKISHVAHGKNSGGNQATFFSNQIGSLKSSSGFYITEGTYHGKHGYSLILKGLEKGFNDNAKARAVVIHGADYADPSFIKKAGRLGRSFGCPALPSSVSKGIIDLIKGGSLIYIYTNDPVYQKNSAILNERAD